MEIGKTLELVKEALKAPRPDIAKAAGFTQSASATSGLTAYDLEAPAKTITPVLTPIRNETPRVVGGRGIQANWRAITGINTAGARAGVSQGNRGAAIEHTTSDHLAAFKGFGLEDFVTFEADYAAEGFDDVKARAAEGTLQATMIAEEFMIVGGNTSLILAKPVVTATAKEDTTGTTTNGTLSVICVALGFDAYWALAGRNNGRTGQSLVLADADPNAVAVFTKTNVDGSSDTYNGGTSIKSDAATCTIDASHKSATASVAHVPGAFGYAWYWGTGGSEHLGAISTINSVLIAADASTTTAVGASLAADHSKAALEFDGLLTIALTAGSGAYVKALGVGTPGTGTKLTSNGAGGIAELDAMFADRWSLYRIGIDELWMNAQQLLDINALVIANGGAPLIRFGLDGASPTTVINAGVVVGSILNPITNQKVAIRVHPNMPNGTILGRCKQLPYKLSGIVDVCRMLLRRDYYQIEWPLVTRKYQYGVYADGVLQHYFPPALAVLTNIAPGR
jgi:hypothetical protein